MSNRRKSRADRTSQKSYGRKTAHRRPMFNFETLKLGRFDFGQNEPDPNAKDRSLSGKDRVRARRGQR